MTGTVKMYWVHALTPLHVGSGRGVGFIDLPIMREKVTGWPIVPGSALKGVLADHFKASDGGNRDAKQKAAFGHSGTEYSNSGSLVFTDSRLVCLPIRSLFGTFSWTTSSLALARLARDLETCGEKNLSNPCDQQDGSVHLAIGSVLAEGPLPQGRVYLEDLDFPAHDCAVAAGWADKIGQWVFPNDVEWQTEFRRRFCILPGPSFDLLCHIGTEVSARVRIESSRKTVAPGALWYEESLPAETILAGPVWCEKVFGKNGSSTFDEKELLKEYCPPVLSLQVGGKATVGRGRVRFVS